MSTFPVAFKKKISTKMSSFFLKTELFSAKEAPSVFAMLLECISAYSTADLNVDEGSVDLKANAKRYL